MGYLQFIAALKAPVTYATALVQVAVFQALLAHYALMRYLHSCLIPLPREAQKFSHVLFRPKAKAPFLNSVKASRI